MLYWYQSQGRVIADEFAAKFYLIAIRFGITEAILAGARCGAGEGHLTREQAQPTAVDFVQAVYPVVSSWLPR